MLRFFYLAFNKLQMKKVLIIGLTLMLLALAGCGGTSGNREVTEMEERMSSGFALKDNKTMDVTNANFEVMSDFEFSTTLSLEDVTNGAKIRGTQFTAEGMGEVGYGWNVDKFVLKGTMMNLPDPNGTDFYEGWLVKSSPFRFVSTGALVKDGDNYVNRFVTETDYSEYDMYVLTIEPDDGDTRPAEHVLEPVVSDN